MTFIVGYITGVLTLGVLMMVDLPWWAAIPIATFCCGLGHGLTNEIEKRFGKKR